MATTHSVEGGARITDNTSRSDKAESRLSAATPEINASLHKDFGAIKASMTGPDTSGLHKMQIADNSSTPQANTRTENRFQTASQSDASRTSPQQLNSSAEALTATFRDNIPRGQGIERSLPYALQNDGHFPAGLAQELNKSNFLPKGVTAAEAGRDTLVLTQKGNSLQLDINANGKIKGFEGSTSVDPDRVLRGFKEQAARLKQSGE